jgi:outer membrane protein insertion porin family
VERLYARRGHHGTEVAWVAESRDGTVDVVYRVREGEPTRIGRILLRGLVDTRPSTVLRELPFEHGALLDPDDLVEAQRRLAELRIFEQVGVEPLRPPPTPFADVEVLVREARPWRLDFGVGYNTFEGFRGFLEVGQDNLWGTGRKAFLRQRISERGDRTELTFFEPRLFGTRTTAQATPFRERREEIGFTLERFGAVAEATRELWPRTVPGLHGFLRYRIEEVDRFRIDPALVVEDIRPGVERKAILSPAVTYDRRDHPLVPTRGSFHLAGLDVAAAPLGSDPSFLRTRLETLWFLDWLRPTVLALSGRVGLARAFADTDLVPIEERFFAGGATTVRGYPENRLGPRDAAGNPLGGNALVILNAEWRFPIWSWFGGAVFVDAGALTAEVRDLAVNEIRPGVGAGLRINTPVGPLRADVGRALRPLPGDDAWQIHLTVGHPF